MRTKLLLTAAVLAAGIVSSQAQSNVYSVNVVGYVNKPLGSNALVMVATPLTDTTNKMSSVYAGLPNNSSALVWNGAGFTPTVKSKGIWSPDLAIPPGIGMFIKSASAATNTYVGAVVANVGTSVTNKVPAGVNTLVGSLIPYAGDTTSTNLGLTQFDNTSQLLKWNGAGYTPSVKAKGVWSPALSFDVAEGFFIKAAGPVTNWVQTLPAN